MAQRASHKKANFFVSHAEEVGGIIISLAREMFFFPRVPVLCKVDRELQLGFVGCVSLSESYFRNS